MRYLIRAVPERAPMVDYLRARLPTAEVVWDQRRDAYDTFELALEAAGDDAAVHLEDDILLTKDFQSKLEAVVAERPGDVVQFFSMRGADLTVGSRYDNHFLMAQCFYMPPGTSRELLQFSRQWPHREKDPTGLDLMMQHWIKQGRGSYWLSVPSLVDHRECVSAINSRRSSKRQSKTFVEPWL